MTGEELMTRLLDVLGCDVAREPIPQQPAVS
jgi:hypothetical protein